MSRKKIDSSQRKYAEFAERFKRARGNLEVTKIAESLGVSREAVYSWMRGNQIPKSQHLVALQSLLNVSADWLVGLDSQPPACLMDAESPGFIPPNPTTVFKTTFPFQGGYTRESDSFAQAISMLSKIFHEGDPVYIQAIMANLYSFSRIVTKEKQNQQLLSDNQSLKERLEALEARLRELEALEARLRELEALEARLRELEAAEQERSKKKKASNS